MIIKYEKPPNYEEIAAVFPLKGNEIFTYGNEIYSPNIKVLHPAIIVHEEVHEKQQLKIGIELWWDWYMKDSKFRFSQEFPAHLAEFKHIRKTVKDRNKVAWHLDFIATRLSSKLYGNLISKQDALKELKKYG